MLPVRDVIPTRTPPAVTIALIAASVLLSGRSGERAPALVLDMGCLWIFGGTLEDRLGHARFAALYLLSGAAAAATQSFAAPFGSLALAQGRLPVTMAIGGAVAGVIGAYFLLFPTSKLLTLVPAPPFVIETHAVALAGVWVLFQLLVHLRDFTPLVATAAGAVTGLVLCLLMQRPERARVEWWSR